ncbi:MAG TPA: S8 family serine peptidase [Candidatus Angelobacter sp.]
MRSVLNHLCIALVLCLFVFVYPLSAQSNSGHKTEIHHGQEVAAHEVLVKFRLKPAPALADARVTEDADEMEEISDIGVIRLHSASRDTATLLRELATRADVEYVEPNFIVHAVATPNDPSFGQLWGLHNTGQAILGVPGKAGADISATSAWNVSTGSRATVIAVIDTGIDYTHPDLAANVWSAPTAFTVNVNGTKITCPAGSHGFNAITNICNPFDDNDHGTHVSGTIGAVGNNALGVVGVNWNASIMGSKFLDSTGSGTTANAIKAIEFAIQAKTVLGASANVRVLSNSWGCQGSSCFSQSLLNEINKAGANNMLFVAAAGNNAVNDDLNPFYPASYKASNVISVAATDNNDNLASFSNFGVTSVNLGAPGVNVLSTIPGNNYAYFSGTSMATPHVSGTALLLLSRCSLATPQLKTVILNNVDDIPALFQKTGTTGRLNASKAINSCAFGADSISPTAINFGFHFLGDPPVNRNVTVTNTGSTAISFLNIDVNSGGQPFSVSSQTCEPSLAAGRSCTITVTFDPSNAPNGTSRDTLTITDSLASSPQTVSLQGSMSCPGGVCP